jgi:formylglycine-generating enzyme required for sulfatase activity
MLGNVWEWVEDCWDEKAYQTGANDARARTVSGCEKRVVRGGSWIDGPRSVRSAFRYGGAPDGRNFDLGFRVSRALQAP